MKRWRGVFLICCACAWPVMAEPVARPAESWEVYDLIAKARIRSIDTAREIQFIESLETQAFGYPVDLDCVETLRMLEHYNESRVLVQGYGYHKGIKAAPPPSFIEAFKSTDEVAVGGILYSDMNDLVLVSVLSDKEWDRFLKKTEETVAPIPDSGGDSHPEDNERVRALKERAARAVRLRGQALFNA